MNKSDQETSNDNPNVIDDEIDLRELFQVIWKGAKLIILTTSAVAIGSVVLALLLSNYYQSQSILMVGSDSQKQGLLSQYSGVASMMGVQLPSSSGEGKAMQAIELIQSRKFVKHLIEFENILPSIMASKSFDSGSKQLIFNEETYDSETKTWKREPNKNGIIKPTYLEAHQVYIGSLMSISQDKETGFILIDVEHLSPVFAKEFLELIIREADTLLREKDLEESSQALKYLKSQLANTSFAAIRESIHVLMERQLQTQMMAKISNEYILEVIEPPFVPEEKSRPHKSMIVILATIIGGFLSVWFVIARHYLFRKRQQT